MTRPDDLSVRPKALGLRHPRIGSLVTDLGIILFSVPIGLYLFAGPWPKGGCGMTDDFCVFSLGLILLVARPTWRTLKWLNDAGERTFTRIFPHLDPHWKPKPLDDF